MAACDVFTMASQWEGLPVALMEALALGLPVVATKVGGIAEELRDGVDALLVPPRDPAELAAALERVVTDPDLRARLADASAARAPEFGVDRTVRVLEETYGRLAAERATRRIDAAGPGPAGEGARDGTPSRRATAPELEIRRATIADRAAILRLLQRSLGGEEGDERHAELFAWKHDRNPFGPSPMWIAVDDGRVAAFRTFMRWEFVRGGEVLRAVRAVDTATDPEYQGRGLFRSLTMRALDEMRAEQVDFVFNTPNSQSRPGYLKMGWRTVGRVPAAVRFVGPTGALAALWSRVPADRWSEELTIGTSVDEWLDGGGPGDRFPRARDVRQIVTNVDDAYLRWRFTLPLLRYRAVERDGNAVVVRSRRRGSALELAVVAAFGDPRGCDRLAGRTATTAGADYAIRTGQPQISSRFVALPGGGPVLTWRSVTDTGPPPLANWNLSLGDIELF
jgi:hypothetical protein